MRVLVLEPLNRSRLGREVHANLIELPGIGQIGLRITLVLNLLQSLFSRTIQLEFEDIDVIGRLHNAIDSALALLHFVIDRIDTQEAQQQVEGVMEVAFVFPLILFPTHGVGHTGQEGRQLIAELFELSLPESLDSQLYPGDDALLRLQITGGNQRQETLLHLIVRKVQQETVHFRVIILDGQIATLVDRREWLLHRSLIIDELFRKVILAHHFVELLLGMAQQTHKIGRCTRLEPVILYARLFETVQNTERIENTRHPFAEMIPVIVGFEGVDRLFDTTIQIFCQSSDRFGKDGQ